MSPAKLAACCGVAAICLSACGHTNPLPGSAAAGQWRGRGVVDDPRGKHVACLKEHHVPFTEFGLTGIQIGTPPSGPTVQFTPTPGAAQAFQIDSQVQGAEVIGSALVYPNQASDGQLQVVENCVALNVKG